MAPHYRSGGGLWCLGGMEYHRDPPAGSRTVPPPPAAAASMARLIAGVSIVLPSPLAPKIFTSQVPEFGPAKVVCACAGRDGKAAPARPVPDRRRKSRRAVLLMDMSYLRNELAIASIP